MKFLNYLWRNYLIVLKRNKFSYKQFYNFVIYILIKLLLLYHYIHCICYLFVWGNSDHITKTMELYLHFKFSKQNLNIKKNCICERLNFVWMYNIIYVIHVSVSWFTVELVTIVNIYIYIYIYILLFCFKVSFL